MQLRSPAAILLALLAVAPLPAAAQGQSGLTLQQVEARYPRMKPVHIQKCDHGDGIYTKSEMLCVASIYQAMYISD
jgi:hypothetical protein